MEVQAQGRGCGVDQVDVQWDGTTHEQIRGVETGSAGADDCDT